MNGSSLRPPETMQTTSSYVTLADISGSNSSDEDVRLDSQQFVHFIRMISVGPVLVVADVSAAAATQRYTVDVLFHLHSSYVSASRCHFFSVNIAPLS